MSGSEEIRLAVSRRDYAAALRLLDRLPHPPSTLSEAQSIVETLTQALETVRVRRAHDAARLAEHIRSQAYRSPRLASDHTWEADA